MPVPIESTLIKQRYKTDNKFSENCIDRGVAIFPFFRQEKPWRQNRIPSQFFGTVSWSMKHHGQADLLSHANFPKGCIRIFALTMSSYMKWKTIKIISPNYTFLPTNSILKEDLKIFKRLLQDWVCRCVLCEARNKSEVIANCNAPTFSDAWRMRCHYCVNETTGKQFPTYHGLLEI